MAVVMSSTEAASKLHNLLTRCSRDSSGRPIVFSILMGTARSGMSRTLRPFVVIDGRPQHVASLYGCAAGVTVREDAMGWSVAVRGAGFHAGQHLAGAVAHAAGWMGGVGYEWV